MSDNTSALREATQRLLRTVHGLSEEQWREPSALPGWSRAHVVAHLVLNADGLAGALEGLATGVPAPMYSSAQARDQDIELLTHDPAEAVRERLKTSADRFDAAVAALDRADTGDAGSDGDAGDGRAWAGRVERVPGGPWFPAAAVPAMRWREVEIHHADLAAGYGHRDWDSDFADAAVEHFVRRQSEHQAERRAEDRAEDGAEDGAGRGYTVVLTDRDRSHPIGEAGPGAVVVSGRAADVAWWLSGRGRGEGLTCEGGDLPQIGAW